VADPITDFFAALTGNFLCLLGAMAFGVMILLLIVILYIRKVRKESSWAYNPDKHLKLRWRRG